MGNLAKRHLVTETEETTALRGLEAIQLLTRLRRLKQQVAEIRRNAHEPSLPLEQLAAVALRAEVIAEAAVIKLGELTRLSQHDLLTDLRNRVLMLDRLENAVAMAHRNKSRFAVLFVDLDGFKHINDAMGHGVGDRVLQLAARRLTSAIRASDTVSRHGGDEFLLLLPETSQASDAAIIADKLLVALSAPAEIDSQPIRLGASVGIAVYPEDGTDAETLITCAETAMYRAKQKGPGGFEFYATRTLSSSNCP
jgi:diguanylate cyclase (GGDEF)-like protein